MGDDPDPARQFDVDLTATQHSLSFGLRLTTLVGAVGLSAAVILILRRYWGWFVLPAQVSIAMLAPALAFAALEWSARHPRRDRLTGVLALVAFAACVANVEILGTVFAFTPGPAALFVFGVTGLALAYGYGSRTTLVAGALCLAAFVMAIPVIVMGGWWTEALRRPETAILCGMGYVAVSVLPTARADFAPWWRGIGFGLVGAALAMLGVNGSMSWLPAADSRPIEVSYTITAFLVGLTMIVTGARRRWFGVSVGGAVLVLVMLAIEYVEWAHTHVPQWLFFLAIGGAALATGRLLQRLRATDRPTS